MGQLSEILYIDAYDSFANNITALLHQSLDSNVTIIKIDDDVSKSHGCSLEAFILKFAAIVLGPGPGDPRHGASATGVFERVIELATSHSVPILGICLGFQTLCIATGLKVERLDFPCHGHARRIIVTRENMLLKGSRNIFEELDRSTLYATCYNSLGVYADNRNVNVNDSRPGSSGTTASSISSSSVQSPGDTWPEEATSSAKILAVDEGGYAMVMMHTSLPFWGFQFHPESCKSSPSCRQLLRNWFTAAAEHNALYRISNKARLCKDGVRPGEKDTTYRSCFFELSSPLNAVRPSEWTRQRLCSLLQSATTEASHRVTWRSLLAEGREEIVDLVASLSRGTVSAMLESNKKGRFSIYAVLPEYETEAELTHYNDINYSFFTLQYSKGQFTFDTQQGQEAIETARVFSAQSDILPHSRGREKGSISRAEFVEALEDFMISRQADGGPEEIPFWGGLVGSMSYEFGLDGIRSESRPQSGKSPRSTDDVSLVWVERCLVYDATSSRVYIQSLRGDDTAFFHMIKERLAIIRSARENSGEANTRDNRLRNALQSGSIRLPDRVSYDQNYDLCQRHLYAGDSYELCLTTEARVQLPDLEASQELELYKNMCAHNPVPYSAFLDFPGQTILSTSPEEFMSWSRQTGTIDMLPMKGTVKRTPSMTLRRATDILNTPKESAENLMIADLIRHDLYKAVGYTSRVEVIKLCEVVEHETVYQLISHVRAYPPIAGTDESIVCGNNLARSDSETSTTMISPPSPVSEAKSNRQATILKYGLRALTTSLPPGSMTGAPKKRSCEILSSLEHRHRGTYAGVIGYLDVGGGGAWSVCIRTAFRVKSEEMKHENRTIGESTRHRNNNEWIVGAGGAITVLSERDAEWEEMMVKLNSVLKGFREVASPATTLSSTPLLFTFSSSPPSPSQSSTKTSP